MSHMHGSGLVTVGGVFEDVADVSFSSDQWFVAYCAISMIDSTSDFDRDNAVAIDIVNNDGDGNNRHPWISGGDHWGDAGAFSNYHTPVDRRFGKGVRFRLRSFHPSDIEAAGWGIIISDP